MSDTHEKGAEGQKPAHLPFDGEYEEKFNQLQGLGWLNEQQATVHAVAFYQLSPREQQLVALVNIAMEVIAGPAEAFAQRLQDMRDQGNGVDEHTAPAIVSQLYMADLLWPMEKAFSSFARSLRKNNLVGGNLLDKMMSRVRSESMSVSVVRQWPWPIPVWLSLTATYSLAVQALVGGNFEYFARSSQEVAIGLVSVAAGLREWNEAGQPLVIGGRDR